MKLGAAILLLFITVNSLAQIELSRQVISCGSISYASGTKDLNSTTGESVISTISTETNDLTQGFQQPVSRMDSITFTLEVGLATCPTSFDARAEIINLQGCTEPYQINWSSGDTGLVAFDLSPGLYSVTVSSAICETTREFEVFSGPVSLCEIKFFNAFSPNNDGVNDTWIIQNIDSPEYAENNVEIYNRWGQIVWSGEDYDNRDVVWTGNTDNGNELGQGTYYYIAEISGTIFKGFIELTK